jgi:transmembrane sensor
MEEQMDDIRELAAKWMDGTITPEEKDRFEKWYNGFDFAKCELVDHWANHPGQIEKQILQKLQASMSEIEEEPDIPVTHIHDLKRSSRWWMAAASVLLLIGAGSSFFYMRNRAGAGAAAARANTAGQTLAGDVAPGHYGAVLTLSNGSNIVLDSAGNGQIATQGTSQVQIENGAVVYEKAKSVEPATASPATASPATASPAAAPQAVLYNTMTTPRGRQIRLILPDGSKVWLNAASTIHYPTAFNGKERAVELSGEAYFEIAKDETKPFVVSASGMHVQVLGTEFNLMAYSDEAKINTTLVDGAVRILTATTNLVLHPDEQASLATNANRLTVSRPNMKEVLAWKEGRFRFDGANITTIMRQVARWYDVDIEYRGALPTNEFNGSISRAEYVNKILGALERTGNVHFNLEGRKIIVMAGAKPQTQTQTQN